MYARLLCRPNGESALPFQQLKKNVTATVTTIHETFRRGASALRRRYILQTKLLTEGGAWQIAANIAKLPELVPKP